MQENKNYIVHCHYCGFKEVHQNIDSFTKADGCETCNGKKVKCPKCGRPCPVYTV
jgi:hypothetical protein